jgi:hypothetical protein
MIRETASFEPSNRNNNSETAQELRTGVPQVPQDELAASESMESEISRLTWAVLDGSASEQQRGRLADLVGAQHQRRRR